MSTQRIDIQAILEKVTVRINTSINGDEIESGTGVIVKNKKNDYFVITAEHCINGKKENRRRDEIKKQDIHILHKSERIM